MIDSVVGLVVLGFAVLRRGVLYLLVVFLAVVWFVAGFPDQDFPGCFLRLRGFNLLLRNQVMAISS